jgi:hypothetical protein
MARRRLQNLIDIFSRESRHRPIIFLPYSQKDRRFATGSNLFPLGPRCTRVRGRHGEAFLFLWIPALSVMVDKQRICIRPLILTAKPPLDRSTKVRYFPALQILGSFVLRGFCRPSALCELPRFKPTSSTWDKEGVKLSSNLRM